LVGHLDSPVIGPSRLPLTSVWVVKGPFGPSSFGIVPRLWLPGLDSNQRPFD
jgi:hypothetical protein